MSRVCYSCLSSYHGPHHPYAHPDQGPSLIRTWPFTSNTARNLESLLTLGEKGHAHQTYFLTSSDHLLSPRFTSDPSPFHIESPLFSTFHLPFTPILSYHPDPRCVHPDSSDHRHAIRTAMFCSYTFTQWILSLHFVSDPFLLSLIPTLPEDVPKHHIPLPDVIQKSTSFVYHSALLNILTSIIWDTDSQSLTQDMSGNWRYGAAHLRLGDGVFAEGGTQTARLVVWRNIFKGF